MQTSRCMFRICFCLRVLLFVVNASFANEATLLLCKSEIFVILFELCYVFFSCLLFAVVLNDLLTIIHRVFPLHSNIFRTVYKYSLLLFRHLSQTHCGTIVCIVNSFRIFFFLCLYRPMFELTISPWKWCLSTFSSTWSHIYILKWIIKNWIVAGNVFGFKFNTRLEW